MLSFDLNGSFQSQFNLTTIGHLIDDQNFTYVSFVEDIYILYFFYSSTHINSVPIKVECMHI